MATMEELFAEDLNQGPSTVSETPTEKPFESDAIRENMNFINTQGGTTPLSPGNKWAQEVSSRVLGAGAAAGKSSFRPWTGNKVEDAVSILDRALPLGPFAREIAGKDVTRASGQVADYAKSGTRKAVGNLANYMASLNGSPQVPITNNMTYDSTYPGKTQRTVDKLGTLGKFLGGLDRIGYELMTDPVRTIPWFFLPSKTKTLRQALGAAESMTKGLAGKVSSGIEANRLSKAAEVNKATAPSWAKTGTYSNKGGSVPSSIPEKRNPIGNEPMNSGNVTQWAQEQSRNSSAPLTTEDQALIDMFSQYMNENRGYQQHLLNNQRLYNSPVTIESIMQQRNPWMVE